MLVAVLGHIDLVGSYKLLERLPKMWVRGMTGKVLVSVIRHHS
jgi:hypothetical protein